MFTVDQSNTGEMYGAPDDLDFSEVWAVCVENDWEYGAEFIPEDEFTDYITDLINDCYPEMVPNDKAHEWPYRHVVVDYEAAADEVKADYHEVVLSDRVTYLVREM